MPNTLSLSGDAIQKSRCMCRTPATRRSNRTILAEIRWQAKSVAIGPFRAAAGSVSVHSMQNENTFYSRRSGDGSTVPVVVWGTGNMGRAAIRAVDAHPGLELAARGDLDPGEGGPRRRRPGRPRPRPRRRRRRPTCDAACGRGRRAVAYMASGDIRPDEALADVARCLRGGRGGRDPGALRALRPPQRAGRGDRARCSTAARRAAAALFASGIDPGWGNDLLPVLVSGLAGTVDQVRCQEIFDYSTYDAAGLGAAASSAWASRWTTSRRWSRPASRPWCGAGRCG